MLTKGQSAEVEWPGGEVTQGGGTQYSTMEEIGNGYTRLTLDDLLAMDTSTMTEAQYQAWETAVSIAKGGGP